MATWQIILIASIWIGCGVGPLLAWKLALRDAFTLLELIITCVVGGLLGPLPILLMLSHKVVLRKARK